MEVQQSIEIAESAFKVGDKGSLFWFTSEDVSGLSFNNNDINEILCKHGLQDQAIKQASPSACFMAACGAARSPSKKYGDKLVIQTLSRKTSQHGYSGYSNVSFIKTTRAETLSGMNGKGEQLFIARWSGGSTEPLTFSKEAGDFSPLSGEAQEVALSVVDNFKMRQEGWISAWELSSHLQKISTESFKAVSIKGLNAFYLPKKMAEAIASVISELTLLSGRAGALMKIMSMPLGEDQIEPISKDVFCTVVNEFATLMEEVTNYKEQRDSKEEIKRDTSEMMQMRFLGRLESLAIQTMNLKESLSFEVEVITDMMKDIQEGIVSI